MARPRWTRLGSQLVSATTAGRTPAVRLVTVPGRPPFTTSHLVAGEEIIEVGTGIPVDVHPTRDLFRLVADPSTGGASR
ncbi:hypothetical protein ACIQVO_11140 [Streptomyces sp. NPDC101062]|uniref:hypothetical protein n=1 Tax=unclassified Streptomyces TaxID=2593676 RepID=UPI003805CF5D